MRTANGSLIMANLLAVGVLCLPILGSLWFVQTQTRSLEDRFILRYAQDVLRSSEQTADQLSSASAALNAVPAASLCENAGLDLMRRLDLASTLLQAVGHAQGDMLACSSFGGRQTFPLGPPDFVSATGAAIRRSVRFFADDPEYLVVVDGAFLGVVHKELPLSFVQPTPGMVLATFSLSTGQPLVARGPLDEAWLRTHPERQGLRRDATHLIAVLASQRFDFGVIAAVPVAAIADLGAGEAWLPLPLGAAAGIVASLLLLRAMRSRFGLPYQIRSGLRNREFHLLYQPIVDLKDGRTVGAEALLRWRRRDGQMISPGVFIPAAEEAGLAAALSKRVFALLGEDLADVTGELDAHYISVNLSAEELQAPSTVPEVQELLAATRSKLGRLMIEATERGMMDSAAAKTVLEEIRRTGAWLAIDDFGTGYSNLGYLTHFKIDFLKIDQMFVRALGTDGPTSAVVARIVDLARDLRIGTIAEGVETPEHAELLRGLGVEKAQGWLFGRPMTMEDFRRRVRDEALAQAAPG